MEYKSTIQKLQYAINNSEEYKVMYNVNQFFSEEQRRPINIFSIKFSSFDANKGKNTYTEVFKSAKQLYIVFFLRNLWYHINGREIPVTDFPDYEMMWKTFAEENL